MKRRLIALLAALCLLTVPAGALTAQQAGELLEQYYIDEVPEQVLAQSTIEEMLAALGDPYTDYYSAQEYADFLAAMEDTAIVGVGIRSWYLPEGVELTQVAPDSPAQEAGLRPGDLLIAIDGHDTRGADSAELDGWMHGGAGTQVTMTVLREGETFSVTMTRREVVFPTVTLDKVEDRIGWITCSAFGSSTFRHFYEIITQYDDQVDEWIVDLRGNGGGDVLAALFSAGCFGGTGSGAYLRSGEGSYSGYLFRPELIGELGYYDGELTGFSESGCLTEHSVHVLVDGETASAAELFCAVIRDSGAGLIIGGRTYGKGVAQSLFSADEEELAEYFADGDAMKITTQRVFSARGATYDHIGILPHILVDADMADEVAALLAAPLEEGDTLLVLGNLTGGVSRLTDAMAIPVDRVRQEENAAAMSALLSGLPATAWCGVETDGELEQITPAQAAGLAGVEAEIFSFSDDEASDWSMVLRVLGLYGVADGVGDGSFRPKAELTRGQLCALLAKALRCPAAESAGFADVPDDAWYAPYVNALEAMGLIEGDGDGLFHPERTVSHQEFLMTLSRAAQWLDMDYYELSRRDGIYGDQLPDEELLEELLGGYAGWAREAVYLCRGGLAWDDPVEIEPDAATTRDEAASAVYNLLSLSGAIPG